MSTPERAAIYGREPWLTDVAAGRETLQHG